MFNISIHSTETTTLRIIYILSVKYNVKPCQIKSMLHVLKKTQIQINETYLMHLQSSIPVKAAFTIY